MLWVGIDDRMIKAHSQTYQNLATPAGIVKLGLALMEKLATLLLLKVMILAIIQLRVLFTSAHALYPLLGKNF